MLVLSLIIQLQMMPPPPFLVDFGTLYKRSDSFSLMWSSVSLMWSFLDSKGEIFVCKLGKKRKEGKQILEWKSACKTTALKNLLESV